MLRRLFGLIALLAAVLSTAGQALAGMDKAYVKPDDKNSWGELLLDFVGHPGFGKSYALVVGISNFDDFSSLPTANDPLKMRDFLIDEAGFDYVHVLTDDMATAARINELMQDILPAMIDESDQFLFYWSGHGETRARPQGGYLGYLPLASSPKGGYSTMVSMKDIQDWDELLAAKQALFLLDACFSGLAGHTSQAGQRDLQIAQLAKPAHHLVSAGTGDEQTIAGDRWGGSIFTDAILRAVRGEADAETSYPRDGVVSLTELVGYVKTRVAFEADRSGWTRSITPQPRDLRTSDGEFFFLTNESKVAKSEGAGAEYQGRFEHGMPVVGMGVVEETPAETADPYGGRDVEVFGMIKDSDIAKDFQDFLQHYPDSTFVPYARNRLARLTDRRGGGPSRAEAVPPDPAGRDQTAAVVLDESEGDSPERASPVQPAVGVYEQPIEYKSGDEFRDCDDCPLMVAVPAGSFTMGSPESDFHRWEQEDPQHDVTIAKFAVGQYEVTFDEWDACVARGGCNGYTPKDADWGRGRRPVINVSWQDAKAYVEWLSNETSQPYRLLSEAEWEYAARAETTTRYWWGDDIRPENANYGGNVGTTTESGSYLPNPWGLYDMNGNVQEWVEDCQNESYEGAPGDGSAWTSGECRFRMLRGGSWYGDPEFLRSAYRFWDSSDGRVSGGGFRVARTLSQNDPAGRDQTAAVVLDELEGDSPEEAAPVQPAVGVYEQPIEYKSGDWFRDCADCPPMVALPGGSFTMGSTEGNEDEQPPHSVTVSAFAIGKYEVTFDEWDRCVADGGCNDYKRSDQGWGRGRRPAINVDWYQAKAYVEWLSKVTGARYRLPSEAEWEYAARAGTSTRYWWGDEAPTPEQENFGLNVGKTTEAGAYPPNPWGLHDMNGNVSEWLEDCWNDSYDAPGRPDNGSAWTSDGCDRRVLRGGSWINYPQDFGSAFRHFGSTHGDPEFFFEFCGFRVARTLSRNERVTP